MRPCIANVPCFCGFMPSLYSTVKSKSGSVRVWVDNWVLPLFSQVLVFSHPSFWKALAVRRKHTIQRARAYQDLVHTLAPGKGCVTLSFMMRGVCVRAGVLH